MRTNNNKITAAGPSTRPTERQGNSPDRLSSYPGREAFFTPKRLANKKNPALPVIWHSAFLSPRVNKNAHPV
jgi:hypothetical protein